MDNEAGRAPTVRLIGAGRLARRLAHLMVDDARLERLWIADPSSLDTALYPTMGSGASNAEGLRHRLAGSPVDVRVVSHWSKPDGAAPGLTVIATPTSEPDRWIAQYLFELGDPYLVVRADHDRASIGPLVLPGRSPCLHCSDMIMAMHRPHLWQHLVTACQRIARPSALMIDLAAGIAAAQVHAFLAGRPSNVIGNTLDVSVGDWTLRLQELRTHPLCPWCGTPGIFAA